MKVTGAAVVVLGASVLFGQSGPGDADLERASGTRLIALRALGGGAVSRVPLEVYVARVLAGEGEPGAPDATQDALAIAIRTFAVFNSGRHQNDGFDVCDTTRSEERRVGKECRSRWSRYH